MSKFSSVFQSKQASAASPETTEEKTIDATPPAEAVVETVATAVHVVPKAEEPAAVKPESKPINMQPLRGKKGHPDYNQVTIYLTKQTQNEAKIALLQARDERDFSELVEELISDWLKQKQ
jgi:hypothetical protein